jgi:hypothetical protein
MNITPRLLELSRAYLSIVDGGDPDRQGGERTAAHEALMDELESEGIPFYARYEARWIARWLVQKDSMPVTELPELKVMFAKPNEYNGIVEELYDIPPSDNRLGYMPVLVTILPLSLAQPVYERNNE